MRALDDTRGNGRIEGKSREFVGRYWRGERREELRKIGRLLVPVVAEEVLRIERGWRSILRVLHLV